MLLVGRQEGHPACKKTELWGTGMVICLKRDADLHMAQLMPLPLTVSCSSKIQIGFTFVEPAHLGSPGKRAVKRVCAKDIPHFPGFLFFPCSLTRCLDPAPLKLRPDGAIQICLLLLSSSKIASRSVLLPFLQSSG